MRRNANKCVNVLKECVKPGNGIEVVASPVETTANPVVPRTVVRILNMAIPLDLPTVVPVETTASMVVITESPPMANPAVTMANLPTVVQVETTVANPAVTTAKHPKAAPVVTTANQADPRMAARISNMAIPLDHRTVAPAAIMESPPMASPIIIQGVTMDQKTVIPRVVGMTNTAVTVQDIHGVPP